MCVCVCVRACVRGRRRECVCVRAGESYRGPAATPATNPEGKVTLFFASKPNLPVLAPCLPDSTLAGIVLTILSFSLDRRGFPSFPYWLGSHLVHYLAFHLRRVLWHICCVTRSALASTSRYTRSVRARLFVVLFFVGCVPLGVVRLDCVVRCCVCARGEVWRCVLCDVVRAALAALWQLSKANRSDTVRLRACSPSLTLARSLLLSHPHLCSLPLSPFALPFRSLPRSPRPLFL